MSGYVFGPVPSRRLGRSLGVDLVPFKTCTYDCIYCQLGRTTNKTVERRQWVPLELVLEELEKKLDSRPDYITLSGSGEPTLFTPLDKLIEGIRSLTDIPIAVLTNGSLLGSAEVRRELAAADLVIPSLDAGNEVAFRLVNRPHEALAFERLLAGLIAFRRRFRGAYWLEVFVVSGYTTFERELADLRRCVEFIRPDRVQLNTVTRPPAENYAASVSAERLTQIAEEFTPAAEVIAEFCTRHESSLSHAGSEAILELLRRRPCTTEGIADGLGIHRHEAIKCVEQLAAEGHVEQQWIAGNCYWKATRAAVEEPAGSSNNQGCRNRGGF